MNWDYDRLKMIAVWTVIIEGIFLIMLMCVDIYMTYQSVQETQKNRQINCVSRYIDDERYAPECEPYIRDYNANRRSQ